MDSQSEDGPCEVTITAPDRAWLQLFVRQLVEDRLAAAAHVDDIESTYRWNNRVEVKTEARAVLHSIVSRVGEIDKRLQDRHPYEVACLVATRFLTGGRSYLAWVEDSSSPPIDETDSYALYAREVQRSAQAALDETVERMGKLTDEVTKAVRRGGSSEPRGRRALQHLNRALEASEVPLHNSKGRDPDEWADELDAINRELDQAAAELGLQI